MPQMGMGDRAGLLALAGRVQHARALEDIFRIAAEGVVQLGMRLAILQIEDADVVLRVVGTPVDQMRAVEQTLSPVRRGSPPSPVRLVGMRVPVDRCTSIMEAIAQRNVVHRNDTEIVTRFIEEATKRSLASLDLSRAGASVLVPVYVGDRPWGLVVLVSSPDDTAHAGLFATQLASAIEVAALTHRLRRTEEELLAREQLATMGELAATVAHEVRNPIGVLFNSIASLRRLLPPGVDATNRSDVETLLSIVTEETERLNEIGNYLLELAGPWAMRAREASLRSIVRSVVDDVPRGPDGSTVDVRLALSDLPPVEIDPRMIRQVVLTLVSNAIEVTPPGATVRVETRLEHRDNASFACVDVTDGRGRSSAVYTTRSAAMRLGLAMITRVVEAHRGELEATSDDEGATFTMRIPVPRWDDSHVSLKQGAEAHRPLRAVGTAK